MDGQSWIIPGAGDCVECHNDADDGFLGFHASQLHVPDSEGQSQIERWVAAELFHNAEAIDLEAVHRFSLSAGSLSERARTYLAVNCASCHRPGGTDLAWFDLRFERTFAEMGICNATPDQGDMGLPDARIVAPGEPGRSVLYDRMRVNDLPRRMPRIGRNVPDEQGLELISRWIGSITSCAPD